MAAPSYGSDLGLITAAEDATNWSELATWSVGGPPAQEADFFIQGTYCVSETFSKSGLGGLVFDYGSGVTIPTDGAALIWAYFAAPNALDTEANGGLRLVVGSSTVNFNGWKILGKDTYQYGGWQCLAINPTVTPDYTVGTPTGTRQIFGLGANVVNAVSKGNPFACDVIRYGRCEARLAGGDEANGYCTFVGFAAVNDTNANRLGLIQAIAGGYLWQGLMTLGYASAVDFRDQNTLVLIANTKKVTANFNKIEIRQSGSRVDWTNIVFQALGTVSKGRLEVIDNADVNITSCSFTNMDTFVFLAASTILTSTFRRCGVITAGGATFTGSLFEGYEGSADSSYLVWDVNADPNTPLTNCSFTKGAAATHAITFGTTSPTTMTLTGINFSGYNASNGQQDSTLYIARTSGTVTINLSGCTGNISYKSAGATVSLVTGQVTVTLTGLKDNTECRVYSHDTTTELAGTEAATDGSPGNRSFGFTLSESTHVDIRLFNVDYWPVEIIDYVIPGAATSLPQQQIFDRVYANP